MTRDDLEAILAVKERAAGQKGQRRPHMHPRTPASPLPPPPPPLRFGRGFDERRHGKVPPITRFSASAKAVGQR